MVDGCGFTGGVGMDDEKDKFRRVLYKCADLILDKGKDERYEKLTYTRFDGMSTTQILDTAMGCIAANELELALLGISYVLYQDKCELTNKHEIERINKLTAQSEVGTIQSPETSENEETINGLTEPSPPPEAA
jgi:hypothetical protein